MNIILKNIFVLILPFLIFLAFSKSVEQNTATMPNLFTRHQKDSLGNMNNQIGDTGEDCHYFSDLEITNDDIEVPQSVGQHVEDCHETPNYNACIYDGNPFILEKFKNIFDRLNSIEGEWLFAAFPSYQGNTFPQLWEDIKKVHQDFNEAMSLHQTYSVNITGTTEGLLKNEHYDVTINPDSLFSRVRQLPNGRWTRPYINQTIFRDGYDYTEPEYNYNLEQIMTYYYLMYQKEWMELNTGRWYASGKNISVVVNHESHILFRSLWNKLQNQIGLHWNYLIGSAMFIRPDDFSVIRLLKVGKDAMNPSIIAHEAGHANFTYSANTFSRLGSLWGPQTQGICGKTPFTSTCCLHSDGCFSAINEGQADFHALMLFPDIPILFDFEADLKTISPFFDNLKCYISRDPELNKNLTSEDSFNCGEDTAKGEVHNMGALYASIWRKIYNREDTSKKDIATLFTEHLPLISNDDTFRTVAVKIINKSKDLFNEAKGEHYACIISQEFTRRGLTPSAEN